jgi:hypothetical protein
LLDKRPITVVETQEFLSSTKKLMDDAERAELVGYLALNPTAGDLIQGTGGVRKMRWGLEGRGKRGGARVIFFFHDMEMPIYLLEAFAKSDRANLTQSECHELRQVTEQIVEAYKRRRAGR